VILALAAVLLFGAPGLLYWFSEWLWFKEVRQADLFWTVILLKARLALIFGIGVFALLLGNALLARALAPRTPWYEMERTIRMQAAEAMELYVTKFLLLGIVALAAVIGYGAAQSGATHWDQALRFFNAQPFGGVKDPIFHRDVGFFVLRLTFWRYIWQTVYATLIGAFIISAVVHYLGKAIRMLGGMPDFASHVKAHLSVLLGLILVVKALGYRLDAYELLFSPRGTVLGAGYTDVHAQLPAFSILAVVAFLCGILLLVNLRFRGLWLPAIGLGFFFVASGLLNLLYPALVQRIKVKPNELARESQYIAYNIKFTRQAFQLDGIASHSFEKIEPLTPEHLARNPQTVENIRLWDWRPLRQAYRQLQELRPFYLFQDVDIDRYLINGRRRQVMLSPRELSTAAIPGTATWQKQHVLYTHGYGVIVSPVNRVAEGGRPDFIVKDMPPISATPDIGVKRPQIYYGEVPTAQDYCVVRTTMHELDYRGAGEVEVHTTYSGTGGVPLASAITRLAIASRFRSLDLLITPIIRKGSRVLFRRNIAERAYAIAPFLLYDPDPYIVVGKNGNLYWIQDAYTVSRSYPYSEPYTIGFPGGGGLQFNYLRNSVKVITDAYNGTITFYLWDPKDAVARCYQRAFPRLFTPREKMPPFLRAHLRYPELLFKAQAEHYATYHMTDPGEFYERVDKWAVAQELAGKGGVEQVSGIDHEPMQPYYVIMRLPDEKDAEFILLLPYTPITKPNMRAWLCARCDGKQYGQLLVYQFSGQRLIDGPQQIESYVDQDTNISKDLSLWKTGGSDVIRGNLLVIPIEKSLLYVEPLFLRAQRGAIPELKRVITFANGKIAMEPTLAEALARVVVGAVPTAAPVPAAAGPPAAGPPVAPAVRALVEQARSLYADAQQRLREGDLAGYAEKMKELGLLLDRLDKSAPR
jgi:hypothetical protein